MLKYCFVQSIDKPNFEGFRKCRSEHETASLEDLSQKVELLTDFQKV